MTSTLDLFPSSPIALDELLAGIARGVVSAQGELDRAALNVPAATAPLPQGEIHVRPLWFVFERTTVEVELSTFVSGGGGFSCRPLDPVAVSLRGHAEAAGTTVRIEIAPLGAELLRRRSEEP